MIEPTIYLQLGISDERYQIISKEIQSIIKSREKAGIMMEMIKYSKTMNTDEKLYAAFMVAKVDIGNKLLKHLPAIGRGMVQKILEE